MTGKDLQCDEHSEQNATRSFAAHPVSVYGPEHPGKKRRRLDDICLANFRHHESAPLPYEACSHSPCDAGPTFSRIQICAQCSGKSTPACAAPNNGMPLKMYGFQRGT